ncbi:glycosyltransferase [Chloroflexota bacterium]
MHGEKRLKILFIPAWYPSEINPIGGITTKEHARAASVYDDIVVLYAFPDPSHMLHKLYQRSEDTEDGIRIIRVKYREYEGILAYLREAVFREKETKPAPSFSTTNKLTGMLKKLSRIPTVVIRDTLYYWGIFTAFRRLVKEGWKPDIIHAHVFLAGVPAIILGKLYRIPVIITERYSIFPLRELSLSYRVKARFAMRRAQMILPVSNALKEAIEAYDVDNKFQVVPNTINAEIFYSSFHRNQSGNKKRILMVGNLVSIKGICYLLQALAQIKRKREDFVLDIVGDGAKRVEYEELAKELELGDAVHFHGYKLKEEVSEFMRACQFLVLPSLCETFGAVIIEALATGKPVVASDVGGIKEIINEDLGILVPPGDVTELQRGIEFMLDNYVNYSPQKLSAHAKGKFAYESVGQLLHTIYQKVNQRR